MNIYLKFYFRKPLADICHIIKREKVENLSLNTNIFEQFTYNMKQSLDFD